MRCIAARFSPGQELRQSLLDLVKAQNLKSAFVITCVGSVTKATLRLADSSTVSVLEDWPRDIFKVLIELMCRQETDCSAHKCMH